ncbi:MAG: hypothetical protein V4644_00735 [Patescibacteria group bacterium]
MLADAQKEALILIASRLAAIGVEYQVTGGLAAIAHGATRPLYDIDIDIHKEDVEIVRDSFKEFIVEDWNNDLDGPDDEFDIWMMKLQIGGVPVDISQIEGCRMRSKGGEWIPQPGEIRAEPGSVEGVVLPVQNKEALISYKKVLGRDTDLIDIAQIS